MNFKPVLAMVTALFLTSCAGSSPASTPTVTVTETVTSTPDVESSEEGAATEEAAGQDQESTSGVASMGEAAANFGVELTVKKAYYADSVPMNKSNHISESGSETYTDVKPDDGGKYLVLETTFNNTGKISKDLTCGFAVAIQAVDTEDRVFDPIEDLYEIKDNPECNAQLQPGFADEIMYVFQVPQDAEIVGVAFNDPENEDYDDYAGIRFDKKLE